LVEPENKWVADDLFFKRRVVDIAVKRVFDLPQT